MGRNKDDMGGTRMIIRAGGRQTCENGGDTTIVELEK